MSDEECAQRLPSSSPVSSPSSIFECAQRLPSSSPVSSPVSSVTECGQNSPDSIPSSPTIIPTTPKAPASTARGYSSFSSPPGSGWESASSSHLEDGGNYLYWYTKDNTLKRKRVSLSPVPIYVTMAAGEVKKRDIVDRLAKGSCDDVVKWLLGGQTNENVSILKQKVKRVNVKYKKLLKSQHRKTGKEAIDTFLEETFRYGIERQQQEQEPEAHTSTLEGELRRLHTPSTHEILVETVQSDMKRKDERIQELEERVKQLNIEMENKNKEMENTNRERETLMRRIRAKNLQLKRERGKHKYYREKCSELEKTQPEYTEEVTQQESADTEDIEDIRKEVIEMEYRIYVLQEEVTSDTVELYDEDNKEFTPQTQRCVQSLLTENVGINHVGNVIREVLKLVDKKPNRVPSHSTIRNMNLQRLVIAQKQIAEEDLRAGDLVVEEEED
ncbi:uncharacterized protein LOC121421886 [Lytechinus variegatus]|uniref:uncharacterized protein LOC121421886 n=1 Tax=Lytechinus variegatus TaxID=7654 RepID=UPI001BB13FFB|nr:uncharacterized protein LOC121421886 [Lytechinus variegatus]